MSIRTWLGIHPSPFLTRNPHIGYLKIIYANGRYVAVGGLQGSLDTNVTAAGPAIPNDCKMVSWSTDGLNWTDAVTRPDADATSIAYDTLVWNGTWYIACASRNLNGTWSSCISRSTTGEFWETGNPRRAAIINASTAQGNRVLHTAGTNSPVSNFSAWSTTGLDLTTNQSVAVDPGLGGFTTNTSWTGGWAAAGVNGIAFTSSLQPGNTTPWVVRTVPWGVNGGTLAQRRWVRTLQAERSTGTIVALVSQTTMAEPTATRVIPTWIYRTTNGGISWTGPIVLPYDAASGLGPYWDLAHAGNVWCCLGYGVCLLSTDAVTWTRFQVPAGKWKSVATDGNYFVAVSEDGYRARFVFDQDAIIRGSARMYYPEWQSEVIANAVTIAPPSGE